MWWPLGHFERESSFLLFLDLSFKFYESKYKLPRTFYNFFNSRSSRVIPRLFSIFFSATEPRFVFNLYFSPVEKTIQILEFFQRKRPCEQFLTIWLWWEKSHESRWTFSDDAWVADGWYFISDRTHFCRLCENTFYQFLTQYYKGNSRDVIQISWYPNI